MRLGAILLVFFSFATLNARLFAAQPPGWERRRTDVPACSAIWA